MTDLAALVRRSADDMQGAARCLLEQLPAAARGPAVSRFATALIGTGDVPGLVGLIYLLAEVAESALAIKVAEAAYEAARHEDVVAIALADMHHRAARPDRAFDLLAQHVHGAGSDALVIKYADFARDVGKSFLGEALLRHRLRGGHRALLPRLAEHYREARNWPSLQRLLHAVPADSMDDYLNYLLGRACVSLLREREVIACADRLWATGDVGTRYAQLLLDVWRFRIGDIENAPPDPDPDGLPFWLEEDARALRRPPSSVLDPATVVRSSVGWQAIRPRENLPNTLVIGTQRSATTWLWFNLSRFAQVQPLPWKETVFFTDAFANPADVDPAWPAREPDEADIYWDGPTRNLFRYLRLYGAGFPIRLDCSPTYAELPDATVSRIRDILGRDLRILLSVRDPVDRSWSNLKYDMKLANVDLWSLSFAERIAHYMSDASFRRSDYATIVARWSRHFPNIKIVFFEDVSERPRELLNEVLEFIGLPQDDLVDAGRVNDSLVDDIPAVDRAFLLGLHRRHYDDGETLFGERAVRWRAQHLAG